MTTGAPGPIARGRGVYVHVPFCRRRCSYCDFYFEIAPADPRFSACVIAELRARVDEIDGPAHTLAFGGGTPTRLPVRDLAAIVDAVRSTVGLVDGAEVALEANPEDLDDDACRALADAGFSRVSVGVQSFHDDVLRWLGRVHDGAHAAAMVRRLVSCGLSVGVDLIVGVPGEGPSRIVDDVARCDDTGAQHVSAYLLTLEQDTPLVQLIARGKRQAIDDDAQAQAFDDVHGALRARGYGRYEISNHARPGHESRHNRLYWNRGDYLGLGPGAHSLRILPDGRARRRHNTARLPAWRDAWLQEDRGGGGVDVEELAPRAALREAIAFSLRDLQRGIDLDALAQLHQASVPDDVHAALRDAEARGELRRDGARAWLTDRGALFSDRVARAVLAGDDDA